MLETSAHRLCPRCDASDLGGLLDEPHQGALLSGFLVGLAAAFAAASAGFDNPGMALAFFGGGGAAAALVYMPLRALATWRLERAIGRAPRRPACACPRPAASPRPAARRRQHAATSDDRPLAQGLDWPSSQLPLPRHETVFLEDGRAWGGFGGGGDFAGGGASDTWSAMPSEAPASPSYSESSSMSSSYSDSSSTSSSYSDSASSSSYDSGSSY